MTLGKGIEQLQIFATFWAFSVIASAFYLFVNGLTQRQLSKAIFDVIFSFAIVPSFLYANLQLNNGEFRLFVFLAVAFGVAITYICFRSTLDKLSAKLYNLFTNKKVDNDGKAIL